MKLKTFVVGVSGRDENLNEIIIRASRFEVGDQSNILTLYLGRKVVAWFNSWKYFRVEE